MFLKKKIAIWKILITKYIEIYDRVKNASAISNGSFFRFSAIDPAWSKVNKLKYYNLR